VAKAHKLDPFNYFSYTYAGMRYVAYCQESAFIKKETTYRMITEAEFNAFHNRLKIRADLIESEQREKLKYISDKERPVLN
jgi:hypothetical protein